MAAKAVALPAKVFSIVEASSYINPVTSVWLDDIGIGSHASKAEYCLLVGDVGTVYFIHSPSRRRQGNGFSPHPPSFQETVDGLASAVG